jgi:hypothetical protein
LPTDISDVRDQPFGRMARLAAIPQTSSDAMREIVGACLQIGIIQRLRGFAKQTEPLMEQFDS